MDKVKFTNRREFLGGLGALGALAGCVESKLLVHDTRIERVGIQTFTLREAMRQSAEETLEMIKSVGYDYVELNPGDFSTRSPGELKRLLEDTGLPSPITHIDYERLAQSPDEVVDIASALGCEVVVLPYIPPNQRSKVDYQMHAEILNRSGEVLSRAGLSVGYHNHQFEFFELGDGSNGMSILLSETDPNLVTFELDLFWAALAGVDVVDLFENHPGRFRLCHIKDLKGDVSALTRSEDYSTIVNGHMANVGEGTLPFEKYFEANDLSGMKYFIVEHDQPPKPFRTSIMTSLEYVRAMRF